MKKYDLSKIMKRAWELVKKAGVTISDGLKRAWKEAKGIIMKGTEKQVAFAKSLIEKFDTEMNGLISVCPEQYKQNWINVKEKLDSIFAEAYAGDVIDVLKDNGESGQKYYTRFFNSVKLNAEPFARKIMEEVYGR